MKIYIEKKIKKTKSTQSNNSQNHQNPEFKNKKRTPNKNNAEKKAIAYVYLFRY